MTLSFTDWLEQHRLIVVSVDPASRRLRLKSFADACTDVACSDETIVVTDDEAAASLAALNAGDVVRLDGGAPGRPERIVVVRRVWDELTSPEF